MKETNSAIYNYLHFEELALPKMENLELRYYYGEFKDLQFFNRSILIKILRR
jgi:hypothetical protein